MKNLIRLAAILFLAIFAFWQLGVGKFSPSKAVAPGNPLVQDPQADADGMQAIEAFEERPEFRAAAMDAREVHPQESGESPMAKASHALVGQVVIVDGTPIARVTVRALQTTERGEPRTLPIDTQTDVQGKFSLAVEQAGSYQLLVYGDQRLPTVGNDTFETGPAPIYLVVDAALLRIQSRNKAGQTVPMASMRKVGFVKSNLDGGGVFSSMNAYDPGWEVWETILSPEYHYVFYAREERGRSYLGQFEAGKPGGKYFLDLVEDAPGFGSAVIRARHGELKDGSVLTVSKLLRTKKPTRLAPVPTPALGGQVSVRLDGLLPGEYLATLELKGAKGFVVSRSKLPFEVQPGLTTDLEASLLLAR